MAPIPWRNTRTIRWILTALAVATLAAGSGTVAAQSSQSGTVLRIHVRSSDGLIYFYVNGPRSPRPACATQSYWIIANENTVSARQQFALLIMAEAAGKSVIVYGTGTCSRWSDGESVVEIAVAD